MPIHFAKQIGSKEFILNTLFFILTCASVYSQTNITDSSNSTKWPIGISGDTAKFKRTTSAVYTNSSNPLKHQFQLNFNNTQFKKAKFHAEISTEINLSSSNYIELGLSDSVNQKIQVRIGNTLDQLQVLKNDTIIFRGQENEFNVSQFHYSFDLKLENDTLIIQKINIQNSAASFDTILLNIQFVKITAYLKIQQYGTSAIGKINYHFLYFGENKTEHSFPEISHFTQLDNQKIAIAFKKPIQTILKNQCAIDNLKIDSISLISMNQVLITISNSKKIKRDSIVIKLIDIKDLFTNNKKSFNLKLAYTFLDTPNFGDIILSEIMSNPSPSLGILPEKKYIEIYNRSSKFIAANTLFISDSRNATMLPSFVIEPFQYYLCVNETDSNFFPKNQTIKIKSFPSFNIESDFVSLKTVKNVTLFQFEYAQNMQKPERSNGGYSLEKTNVNVGTLETDNWQSNSTIGGTPGAQNSNDTSFKIEPFRVIESYFKNDTLTIKFNHNTNPNKIGKVKFAAHSDTIYLNFFQNIAKGYCKYPSTHSEKTIPILIEDVLGNNLVNPLISYNTHNANSNIKFNEILFHNLPYKPDFFEIINIDTTAIFLENINLKIFDENFQNFKSNLALKNKFRELIVPNELLAFTSNSNTICDQFPLSIKEKTIELINFPNFSSEGGSLLLTNIKTGLTTDKLTFNDNYHSPNIATPIGISLEKNSVNAESNDYRNWQSALESCGGATPGQSNSVSSQSNENKSSKHFNILQKRILNQNSSFTPLQIYFQFPESGYVCNAIIFNKYGQIICESIKNQRLAQHGTLTIWPSTENKKLPSENYIIKLEAFYPNGDLCREIHRFTVLNQ